MSAPDALPTTAALLVIDLQKAIDAPYWGPRNNPDCERNVAALLERWRATRRPIYHIKHDSTEPQSAYRPGQPGNDFKDDVKPQPDEAVITKRVNSVFVGTGLGTLLKVAGHGPLVITGVRQRIASRIGKPKPSWLKICPASISRSSNRQSLNSRRKTIRSICAYRSRCWQQ